MADSRAASWAAMTALSARVWAVNSVQMSEMKLVEVTAVKKDVNLVDG